MKGSSFESRWLPSTTDLHNDENDNEDKSLLSRMRDENDGDGCYGTTSVRYIHKGFLGFTRNTYAGISFTPFLKTFLRVTRWMCLGEEALHELF